ncbi:MAG TPA: hypothetical protein VLF18_01100 [Tahibacter sp.]|uniref:hypothetical protein n=1 Tax=Tahibacter sp. TaxID=2056211 RepID=UPI002BB5EBF0|nr:hypothetical protein [Tahibacter sp.]HSX58772.1 hypothetical protein [Tahibacter sp.]
MRAERPLPPVNPLGLATALMVALAGGAVWALAALWRQDVLAYLAMPLGFVIGRILATNGPRNAAFAAVCAAAFSAAASAYALWMIASGRVAMLLGMRLTDIFGAIGIDLAYAVAWARLSGLDLVFLGAAAIIAAVAALWQRHGATAPDQSIGPANS